MSFFARLNPFASPDDLGLALSRAAEKNDLPTLRRLLARGASPRWTNHYNSTPLHEAASKGSLLCAAALLPLSDAKAFDGNGDNAMKLAVYYGHADVARILIPASDLSALDEKGESALRLAARLGFGACVEELLPHADPLAVDAKRRNALHLAAEKGWLACVEMLLPVCGAGALTHNGDTALMLAALEGYEDVARLLAPLSDLSARDRMGWSAADNAKRRGHGALEGWLRGAELAQMERASLQEVPNPTSRAALSKPRL